MSNEKPMSLPKLPQTPIEKQSVTAYPEEYAAHAAMFDAKDKDSVVSGNETVAEDKVSSAPAPKKRGRPRKAVAAAESEASMRARVEAEVRAEIAAEAQAERAKALAATSLTGDGVEINQADPNDEDAVMINFVDDGLTLLGRTWCRGEELTVKRGSGDWNQTLDARGRSILDYTEAEQMARWERRLFAKGPWLGKGYNLNDPNLTDDERAMLRAAEERRKIREAQPGARGARQRLNSRA